MPNYKIPTRNKINFGVLTDVAITRVPNRVFGIRDLAFWSPGFGILKKYGIGIRDCIYGRDAGFSVFTKQDARNRHFN